MEIYTNLGQNAFGVFTGAYAQRQQKTQTGRLALSSEQPDRIKQGIRNVRNSFPISDSGTKVSISKADIDFLCSEKAFLKMKQDAEGLYTANAVQQQKIASGRNSEDVFWNNTGDQWLTFSKTLAEGGFYDGMNDDELKNFEGMLEQITSEMDNLSKNQYNTGIDFGIHKSESNFFMTSAEAMVALESSTAALQYMSDKLIPGALQDKFNSLLAMYQKHNEEILSEYHNPMESFDKSAAGIHKAGDARVSDKPVDEYKYTIIFGKISKSDEENRDFRKQLSALFKEYGARDDRAEKMDDVKELFAKFVTGDSNDDDFRQYALEKSEYLFHGIQRYWENLMNLSTNKSKEAFTRNGSVCAE